jgi:hypothetical protein
MSEESSFEPQIPTAPAFGYVDRLAGLDMYLAADPQNPPKSRNIYPRNDEAGDPLLGNLQARDLTLL